MSDVTRNSCGYSPQNFSSSSLDRGEDQENLGLSINDLPEELIVMIFLELDSKTRRKIERVCTTWRKIMREVKILRTHVKLELELGPPRLYSYYENVKFLMDNLATPELQSLHLVGVDPVCGTPFKVHLIVNVACILEDMKIGNVELLVTNFVLTTHLQADTIITSLKRIIIRNSWVDLELRVYTLHELDYEYCYFQTKWFTDLVLDMTDFPRQLANIYLNDSGPLERSDNELLVDFIDRFDDHRLTVLRGAFADVGVKVDLRELSVDVAGGRQIPKFIAKAVIQFSIRHPRTEEDDMEMWSDSDSENYSDSDSEDISESDQEGNGSAAQHQIDKKPSSS